MIIVSVKAPPPPLKCTCTVAWETRPQVTPQVAVPENQVVPWNMRTQVAVSENQVTSDVKLVLEYTIS